MTLAVQVSAKTNAGTIFVIGGNNVDEFRTNLLALYTGPNDDPQAAEAAAEELLEEMGRALSPMGAAVQAVTTAMPGSAVQQYPQGGYVAQGQPQPQYGGGEIVLRIPWKDKVYADPFLTPLKANRQVRWDGDRKVWIAQAGTPMTGLERWVSA